MIVKGVLIMAALSTSALFLVNIFSWYSSGLRHTAEFVRLAEKMMLFPDDGQLSYSLLLVVTQHAIKQASVLLFCDHWTNIV